MEYVINSYHGSVIYRCKLIIHKNSHCVLHSPGRRTARPEARAGALKADHSPAPLTSFNKFEASWFIKMSLRINMRRKKRQLKKKEKRQVWGEEDENRGPEKIHLLKPKGEQQAGGSLGGHVLTACRGSSSQTSHE